MLLEELLSVTDEGHPDEEPLREALERVKDVAKHINEEKRSMEEEKKLKDLAERFAPGEVPDLVRFTRRFVREGDLIKARLQRRQRRRVFLFNDLLLYAVSGQKGYTIKGATGRASDVARAAHDPRTPLTPAAPSLDCRARRARRAREGREHPRHRDDAQRLRADREVGKGVHVARRVGRRQARVVRGGAEGDQLEQAGARRVGLWRAGDGRRRVAAARREDRPRRGGHADEVQPARRQERRALGASRRPREDPLGDATKKSSTSSLRSGDRGDARRQSSAFFKQQGAKKDDYFFSVVFERSLDFAATSAQALVDWYLALAALVPRSSEPLMEEDELRARIEGMAA